MKDTLETKESVSEMSSTESASAASLKESSDSVSKIVSAGALKGKVIIYLFLYVE